MTAFLYKPSISESQNLCEIHKVKLKVFSGREFCEICSTESYKRSQAEHQLTLKNHVLANRYAGAMLPARHAKNGFSNYEVLHAGHKTAKAESVAFVKDFLSGPDENGEKNTKRNLIMVGRTGNGKTHLACGIARNIVAENKSVRYITSEDMAKEISLAWDRSTSISEESEIARFTDFDLLILDEYGLHDQHESRLQLIHKVLYSRYDKQKPTVLISNWTKAELQQSLGDRLWSRFQHDGLTVIECNWSDARVGGL